MTAVTAQTSSLQGSQPSPPRSTHDLKVDSMYPLRWSSKLIVEDVALGSRIVGWQEHSRDAGEGWLRNSAESGDLCAMERLGLRLFNGEGLEKAPREGLSWLRRSAELGNVVAMVRLAECLMSVEGPLSEGRHEAERWLQRCIAEGNRSAAVVLGSRLVVGVGLIADPARGKQLLINAARGGSQLAHVKLGVYLVSGMGLQRNREQGLAWWQRIGVTGPNHVSLLAYYTYLKSIAAPIRESSRMLAEEAAILFKEAAEFGNDEEYVNLAYLLRRREISAERCPSIEKLLVKYVNAERPFALMNQALRLGMGIDCAVDWRAGDILIGKIKNPDSILRWWLARSQDGDAEGHLVIAWLVRRHLIVDPEQKSIEQRMHLARAAGWSVPRWMDYPADFSA